MNMKTLRDIKNTDFLIKGRSGLICKFTLFNEYQNK